MFCLYHDIFLLSVLPLSFPTTLFLQFITKAPPFGMSSAESGPLVRLRSRAEKELKEIKTTHYFPFLPLVFLSFFLLIIIFIIKQVSKKKGEDLHDRNGRYLEPRSSTTSINLPMPTPYRREQADNLLVV